LGKWSDEANDLKICSEVISESIKSQKDIPRPVISNFLSGTPFVVIIIPQDFLK
jgi:hypothetical protein